MIKILLKSSYVFYVSVSSILLMYTSLVFAETDSQGTLSSKPYTKTIELDSAIPSDLHNSLPELGDVSQTVLSPLDEQRIAEQILAEVAVSDSVLQDIEIIDYLQNLGDRLAAASDDKRQPFYFFMVQDNSINAFAMPGGVIGVHTGLFLAANTESELSSVIGHEIGHITQHHIARILAKQKTDTFKNIAGIALALLVARANPELAAGALTTSSAAMVQRQLDYTREHEREADRIGLNVLVNAGFDPRGMPAFFTTLQRGTRFVEGNAPSFLRTHPLTSERIADVSNRVENMPYKQVNSSLEFYLVRAKLRASNGLAQVAIDQFERNIQEQRYASEAAEHYGLAVALLRKKDIEGVTKELKWLLTNAPKNAFIDNLKARAEVVRNNPKAAAKVYTKALVIFPDDRGLIYGYAEHFLAIKQFDQAVTFIKNKQNRYPNDAYLYRLLAKAYAAQSKSLLSFQAQAEAYYSQYNYAKAVEQMRFSTIANDGSFYEKSIVEARLKELERELLIRQKS